MSAEASTTSARAGLPAWLIPTIAGLIGASTMTVWLGPSLVDPTNIDWLMHADYRLHFLGYHLYRSGPWTLPIGAAPLLIWPIGSSVGLTDAIPLVALPLKLIDPLLPDTFQFIGLWMVLSFALQGVFGALLMRLATPRPSLQLLGAVIFILSPPLIFRILHAALTAHWLVLGALWLSLKSDADVPTWRRAFAWAALVAASAATQPYIMLMIAVLMGAAHARLLLAAPRRIVRITLQAALSGVAALVTLWQSGSLMVGEDAGLEIAGFGGWSTNLLAFIMPTEAASRFFPGVIRYASGGQYEGYAYLGAGTLLLAPVALIAGVVRARHAKWRLVLRHLPLLAALLFLELMALGNVVTFGERTLFSYDVEWWGPLTIFRTHGRNVWPLFYATTTAILFAVSRFRYGVAVSLLTVGAIAQIVDVGSMKQYVSDLQNYGYREPLQNRFWTVVPQHYRQLVLIPTNLCQFAEFVDYTPFSLLAGRKGLGINAGITARYDTHRTRLYCRELATEIYGGLRSDDSLYIIRADLLDRIAPKSREHTVCTLVDGFAVCFSRDSATRWSAAFDVARARLPAAPEFEGFYDELDEIYRSRLGRPARDVAGDRRMRIEAMVRYLAYRVEGCTHAEAETKVLGYVNGDTSGHLCDALNAVHQVPPADQTHALVLRLEEALRSKGLPASQTHVDTVGEAVWLQAYVQERVRGVRDHDARARVFAAMGVR